MWNEDMIIDYLKENLAESRFIHSMGVVETAEKLAQLYEEDITKARFAALLHDCSKNLTVQEQLDICYGQGIEIDEISLKNTALLHCYSGVVIASETMKVKDDYILNAIRYHTTGRENMTKLEKIIYLADYIEPNRIFKKVQEVREIAFGENLDKALLLSIDNTINYIIERKQLLHIDTIKARNYLILNGDK